ncbi:MAG: restriction endonuclease subunit S [Lachnospiraceae bacterium]|nr:restriction endonuclease subunit S [Lachnospiraceae bacterium]
MMTAEQLKGSILQLAMQGKLVEQRPEEGTGEELYKEIQKDKKNLIKDGSIKAGKKYNAISEEEIMFDIPETWVWTRLSDIVFNRGQKKPENVFSYIDIGSIDNVHQKLNDEENIIEAENAPSRARKIVAIGDVIYSTVRPYLHNMCIIDREFSHEPIASTGFAAMTCHEGLYNRFLFYYLLSPDFDRYANDTENSKGVAYPAINDQKLYKALVPLPPLAEQKRIVAKIEELMPFVEQYAAASTKLNTLNASFPEMMKKSILQEAVQGKLVPQDPNDEPASLLLKKIAEEKNRLIKEGKIKKQKPIPEITEDEIPFDIPESWEWARLGDLIFEAKDGPHFSPKYQDQGVPFISTRNISGGKLDFSEAKFISEKDHIEFSKKVSPKKGDILYSKGGTTGIAAVNDTDIVFDVWVHVAVLSLGKHVNPYYLATALNSPHCYNLSQKYTHGTGNHDLGLTRMIKITIPLPPIKEQQRIVDRLDEILPIAEELAQ